MSTTRDCRQPATAGLRDAARCSTYHGIRYRTLTRPTCDTSTTAAAGTTSPMSGCSSSGCSRTCSPRRRRARSMRVDAFVFDPLGLDAPLFTGRRRRPTVTTSLARERPRPTCRYPSRGGGCTSRPLSLRHTGRRLSDSPCCACRGTAVVDRWDLAEIDDLRPVDRHSARTWHVPGRHAHRRADDLLDPTLGRVDRCRAPGAPGELVPHESVSLAYGAAATSVAGHTTGLGHSRPGPRTASLADGRRQVRLPAEARSRSFATAEAVRRGTRNPPGTLGVIAILDSRTYAADLDDATRIRVPAGSQPRDRVGAMAGGRPRPGGRPWRASPGRLAPAGARPHLRRRSKWWVRRRPSSATPGELVLDGLLVEGALAVVAGDLGALRVDALHARASEAAASPSRQDRHGLQRPPSGARSAARGAAGGRHRPPEVDGAWSTARSTPPTPAHAIAGDGSPVALRKSTFLGRVRSPAPRRQRRPVRAPGHGAAAAGRVRAVLLRAGRLARRRAATAASPTSRCARPRSRSARRSASRLAPSFTSVRYKRARLRPAPPPVPEELRTGAEDWLGDGRCSASCSSRSAQDNLLAALERVPPVRPRSRPDLSSPEADEDIMKGDFTR